MGGGCVEEGEDFGEAGIASSNKNKTCTGLLGMEVKFQQLGTSQNQSCSEGPLNFTAVSTTLSHLQNLPGFLFIVQ